MRCTDKRERYYTEQFVVTGLFADSKLLLAESKGTVYRIVAKFHRACLRSELHVQVNVGKSRTTVLVRAKPYRARIDSMTEGTS